VNPSLLSSMRQLVERFNWTLVHFLWQGSLIACLYVIARVRFSRPEDARVRYVLSCTALAAMIAAPAITFVCAGPKNPAPTVTFTRGMFVVRQVASQHEAAPFESLPVTAPFTSPSENSGVAMWIATIWLAGASLFSTRLIGAGFVVARMRSRRVTPPPFEWQSALDSLLVRLHISIPVRLLISESVQTPTVAGWLKPAILLPSGEICGISPEHIEALLAHELAHIRRHDYIVNLLQRIAETLLFYHPAVWWLSAQIGAEREACCDDIAVALTGDPLTYVCALAGLESNRPEHLAHSLAANGGSLKHRIARLLGKSIVSTLGLRGTGLLTAGVLLGFSACVLWGQVVDSRPAFEVASVKPDKSGTGVDRIKRSGGGLVIQNVSLKRLIGMAYGVADGRDYLFKGPAWIDSENFDISAKFPPETSDSQMLLMLQRLLDERFKMKLHREPREFSVYALVVDKPGSKVHPSATPGAPVRFTSRGGHAVGLSVTMAQFADRLSREDFQIGRRVVDATGLPGTYDLTLDWKVEGGGAESSDAAIDRPSIFSALTEQLGLKLEPRKVSLDVLIVDEVLRRPVEN
jgi:uncharacterized protein (TIGR03435 family)